MRSSVGDRLLRCNRVRKSLATSRIVSPSCSDNGMRASDAVHTGNDSTPAPAGQKTLRMPHRFESSHPSFPFSGRLVRILGTVIQSSASSMFDRRDDFAVGAGVACKLVGYQRSWTVLESLEELSEKAFGGVCVASALHQNVEHFAFLVHRPPQVDELPVDLADYFIEMPGIPTPTPPVTQTTGVLGTELQTPQANGFMGHHNAALQHHFLGITETLAEAEVQPDAMGNDLGGWASHEMVRRYAHLSAEHLHAWVHRLGRYEIATLEEQRAGLTDPKCL